MGIYIFTLFFIFLLWIIINKVRFTLGGNVRLEDRNKAYVICFGFWLFIVAALRNYTVGTDLYVYLRRYVRLANAGWKDIFHLSDIMMFEYGFSIINKLLGYISKNPRFFLVIVALFIIYLFSLEIYKNSSIPWLSFLIFIAMGLFGSSLSTVRQYIAVAIILYSYNAIKNNKLFEFVVLVILAYFIHTSAIIVLPMFWISKIKFTKFNISAFLIILLSIVFLIFYNTDRIVSLIAPYMSVYNRYLDSLEFSGQSGAIGATLIYIAFCILVIFKLYNNEDNERNMHIAFAIASVILVLFSFIISISARILPYFASMFIFSVPKAIDCEVKHRIQVQYLILISIVLIIYYFSVVCRADVISIIPYELWNNDFLFL